MKRRYIWWGIVLGLLVAGAWAIKEYNRQRKDSASLDAKFHSNATGLLQEFLSNEQAANKKYAGLEIIIAVSGCIKETVKNEQGHYTLLLGDSNSLSSVRCSIDTVYSKTVDQLKKGNIVRIKGNFNGYKPDELGIGADIEMNFCVVDSPQIKK